MSAAPVIDLARLTPDELAALMPAIREAMKDKSYQHCPLGEDVAAYLRAKRKQLTDASYIDYEGCLDKLARYFPDLRVEDFEPPTGTNRLEEFLDHQWGTKAPRTYNKNLSIVSDFFLHWQRRGRIQGNPTLLIGRARKRDVHRTTFTADQIRAIIASQEDRRDRLCVRLLLHYALRKSALASVEFKHFDHQRRRLTIFTKGEKVREIPIPDPAFWLDLERLILDAAAEPDHYLLPAPARTIPVGKPGPDGRRRVEHRRDPKRRMSGTSLHRWWYARLAEAAIVATGTTSGERMHKARHTAGQRLLDHTQNLKAVQKLLGHSSMATTADIYVDWDLDQLAGSLAQALTGSDD